MQPTPFSQAEAAAAARTMFGRAGGGVEHQKRRKRIARLTAEAVNTYAMRPEGPRPRWLVCLSGGKDSHTLLAILLDLLGQGRLDVDLLACNLDQGHPGFPQDVLPAYLSGLGVPYRIECRDTLSIVREKLSPGATQCSLCSRLRRGHLYRVAREEGCDAIVLGHHRDDILETFLLNLFFGGRLEAMPPALRNDAGDLLTLRPLSLVPEEDCARLAADLRCPIIPCTLCGSQDGLRRQEIKAMLAGWDRTDPGRRESMFRALTVARPGHLLDPALFDFAASTAARPARTGGRIIEAAD